MHRLRTLLVGLLAVVTLGAATGCLVVSDPWTTARNAVTAGLKEQLLSVLTEERRQIRRMARRLSALTDLAKYALTDAPRWRHHPFQGEQFLYAEPFNAALNGGDPTGRGYTAVSRERQTPGAELTALQVSAPEAYAAIVSALATMDLADSTLIAGTDQTGQIRVTGKHEIAAIDALNRDVIDPSPDQSATAVLDKISGSALMAGRQHHARLEFLTAIVEQLLVDNKRDRDTEAAVMNMQLGRIRHGAAANAALVTGAGDALRTWRQP